MDLGSAGLEQSLTRARQAPYHITVMPTGLPLSATCTLQPKSDILTAPG